MATGHTRVEPDPDEVRARFRKKPVVIEAFQVQRPREIETLEGTMRANVGDWIITGVKGEQYPCAPDIFAATYEAVVWGPPIPDEDGAL